MKKYEVAIIIPGYYKSDFSSEELISLKHLNKYLNKYDKYFIVPDNAVIDKGNESYHYVVFPRYYFRNTKTYNKLLLKSEFYEKFIQYKYILIYQMDALVFSNHLSDWCDSEYSYVAAPWFKSIIGYLSHKKGVSPNGGNGGFSLRNIKNSLEVLKIVNSQAKRSSNCVLFQKIWFIMAVITGKSHGIWLNAPADNYPFNEDGFWSLEAPKYSKEYKVVPFKESVQFAFERFPRRCYKINNEKLPFGCHAWSKYDKDFWTPHLLK